MTSPPVATAVARPPVIVRIPREEFRQTYLDIYAKPGNERLVTTIEVLSPNQQDAGQRRADALLAETARVLAARSTWSRSISCAAGSTRPPSGSRMPSRRLAHSITTFVSGPLRSPTILSFIRSAWGSGSLSSPSHCCPEIRRFPSTCSPFWIAVTTPVFTSGASLTPRGRWSRRCLRSRWRGSSKSCEPRG